MAKALSQNRCGRHGDRTSPLQLLEGVRTHGRQHFFKEPLEKGSQWHEGALKNAPHRVLLDGSALLHCTHEGRGAGRLCSRDIFTLDLRCELSP